MPFDPDRHHRRSIRLRGYDYAQAGAYFVTICEVHRECIFGEVRGGKTELNGLGEIVREEWLRTAQVRPNIHLDEFVVMPNHFHGILVIDYAVDASGRGEPPVRLDCAGRPAADGDPTRANPLRGPSAVRHEQARPFAPTESGMPHAPARNSLGAAMMQFKSIVAKRINIVRGTQGNSVWQRDYYEHVIRNEREWEAIAAYIRNNPASWANDPDNPANGIVPRDYWHNAGLM